MPRQSGRRKKTRTHNKEDETQVVDDDTGEMIPKSFIIKRGKIGLYMQELLQDMRNLMYPYTAAKLKESKKNSLKDFVSAAGQFGVSHMMILTQTENGNYLRIAKNPKGPTMVYKIEEYALARDIVKFQQANKRHSKIFSTTLQAAPLLIMNGFGNREENDPLKLASLMLQSMFPPIKVQSMNLSTCKRVVMFNINDSKDQEMGEKSPLIEFRHYGVSARQRSVNRGIKKLVNNQKVPNLAKYKNIQDFIMRNQRKQSTTGSSTADSLGAYSSESEVDDLPGSKVTLPEDYQDKKKDTQVAIRLHELGPRLQLRLIKIEEGFCRGNVVFHAHQSKTAGEVKKQIDSLKDKRKLKASRKAEQEENIRKKQEKKGKKAGDDYEFEKDGDEEDENAEGPADMGDAEANVDENQTNTSAGGAPAKKGRKAADVFAGKKRQFSDSKQGGASADRTVAFTKNTKGGAAKGPIKRQKRQ